MRRFRPRPYWGIRINRRGVRPYAGIGCWTLCLAAALVLAAALALGCGAQAPVYEPHRQKLEAMIPKSATEVRLLGNGWAAWRMGIDGREAYGHYYEGRTGEPSFTWRWATE